jgi:hypothetical protein
MHDVETLGFVLGQPGFAYTNHTIWDLGLDNPHLITASVPKPSSLMEMAIALFGARRLAFVEATKFLSIARPVLRW